VEAIDSGLKEEDKAIIKISKKEFKNYLNSLVKNKLKMVH
jgi:hypothetical protein